MSDGGDAPEDAASPGRDDFDGHHQPGLLERAKLPRAAAQTNKQQRFDDVEVCIPPPGADQINTLPSPDGSPGATAQPQQQQQQHRHHHLKRAFTLAHESPLLRPVRRLLRRVPRPLLLLAVFPVVMGLVFLAGALPAFLIYRDRGIAGSSAQFRGWVGCGPVQAGDAVASADAAVLLMHKAISPGTLTEDLAEWDEKDLEAVLVPACPWPDPDASGHPVGRPNQPYLKVTFLVAKIMPDESNAALDISAEAVNQLDADATLLLSREAGQVTLTVGGIDKPITFEWTSHGGGKSSLGNKVSLQAERPFTNYPWDLYHIIQSVEAEILLFNNTAFPHSRPLPVQVWTQSTIQLFSVLVDVKTGDKAGGDSSRVLPANEALEFWIWRSTFTRLYCMVVILLMWFLGGLTLLNCLDNVWLRPRDIKDAYAAALLFGLPSFRGTMPGAPPVGAAIDVLGLIWAELMVVLAIIISTAAFVGQYRHKGALFRRVG